MAEEVKLNVYQKLIKARKSFLDSGISKSGINRHLEFKYFELSDIVPTATKIFDELGLVAITSFTNEFATLELVDCDDPNQVIVFTSPMRELQAIVSNTGKVVANEIQTLGSLETYQRRYLYLICLDIVENDEIDASAGNTPSTPKKTTTAKVDTKKPAEAPTTKETTKPATVEERAEVKEKLTDVNGVADELQVKSIKKLLKEIVDLDNSQGAFVKKLAQATDSFTKVSREQAEETIKQLKGIVEELKKKPKELGAENE